MNECRTCCGCQGVFAPRNSRQSYCTTECALLFHRGMERPGGGESKIQPSDAQKAQRAARYKAQQRAREQAQRA